ncbi:hypothetical protein NC651_025469 [Populus alba x Populus x berolinensis]|nr:hypothetical protein NC651_025469 [Populus alba x Populus x berolinensis]
MKPSTNTYEVTQSRNVDALRNKLKEILSSFSQSLDPSYLSLSLQHRGFVGDVTDHNIILRSGIWSIWVEWNLTVSKKV